MSVPKGIYHDGLASSGLTNVKGLLEDCGDDLVDRRDMHRQINTPLKLPVPILTPWGSELLFALSQAGL